MRLFFQRKRWLVIGLALVCGLVTALGLTSFPPLYRAERVALGKKISYEHYDKDVAVAELEAIENRSKENRRQLKEKLESLLRKKRKLHEEKGFLQVSELLSQRAIAMNRLMENETAKLERKRAVFLQEISSRTRLVSPYDVVKPSKKVDVRLPKTHLDLPAARELYAIYMQKKNEHEDSHITHRLAELSDIIVRLLNREIEGIETEIRIKSAIQEEEKRKIEVIDARLNMIPEREEEEKKLSLEIDIATTQLKEATLEKFGEIDVKELPRHIGLLSLIAALIGGIVTFGLSLRRGLPLSLDHIREEGGHVSGILTKKSNLVTLRNLSGFIGDRKKVALLLNRGPNYSHDLAKLIAKQGKKTLLVQTHFSPLVQTTDVPGLSHYLSGDVKKCPIRSLDGYDYIPMGEKNAYGTELLRSYSFAKFIEEMEERYDHILLYSRGEAEGKALTSHVDVAAFTVNGEKLLSFDRDVTFLAVGKS